APEHEAVLHLLEPGEGVLVVGGEGVALRAVLRGARGALAADLLEPRAVAPPEVVEPGVDVVDELLVGLPRNSCRVRLHHGPSPLDRLTIIYDVGTWTTMSVLTAAFAYHDGTDERTAVTHTEARAGTLHVLLVEDDDGDAVLVEELLSDAGLDTDVTRAWSLEAAVDALAFPVDCVLLDLGLPDATGFDALVRLRDAS